MHFYGTMSGMARMISPMKSLAAILVVGAAFASHADDAAWFDVKGAYSFDVASAYISRGKVSEDRPIQVNEMRVDTGLGPFGRVGLWYWNFSSLTDRCQHKHRRFVPEQNYGLFHAYDVKIAEGWSFSNEVMVEWQTFHGEKPENGPSVYEWRIKQSLNNPYATPYWNGRFTVSPLAWNYYQVGLKRTFKIAPWLTLAPNAAMDFADGAGCRKRFGARPEGDYHSGAVSALGELTAVFPVTDDFSFHATVGQFGVINQKGRGNLHGVNRRDLTYGQVGFKLTF